MRKIIQIIPAEDIVAEYEIDGRTEIYPVICWALVEYYDMDDDDLNGTYVEGMEICGDFPFLIPSGDENPVSRFLHIGKKAEQIEIHNIEIHNREVHDA